MFEKIRLLRDRFSYPLTEYDDEDFRQLLFRLSRKDTVTDLLKLFDKQLSTSYRGRSTAAFKYWASSNCFEILYHRNLRAGFWWRFIWSFCFAACTVIHKVSRAITKRKEHFLRIFQENILYERIIQFTIFGAFENYCTPSTSWRDFPPPVFLDSRRGKSSSFLDLTLWLLQHRFRVRYIMRA